MPDPTPHAPAATPSPAMVWAKRAFNLLSVAAFVVGCVMAFRNGSKPPAPPVLIEGPAVGHDGEPLPPPGVINFGWTPDPVASRIDAAMSGQRTFGDTPAGQATDLPSQVFLWKGVEKITGKPAPLKDQNPTGSCVGFGDTTAVERTEASEVLARGGDPSEFTFFAEEVTYAGSKVQGARSLGAGVSRGDGSSGVFVKAFLGQYGMCPKGKYGDLDLTAYDATRAHGWNTSGPPSAVLDVCKRYPVRDVVKVTSWVEAKRACASGYATGICANWKFSAQRDANGVARDLGTGWQHCMCLDGYYVDPASGKEYGHIENSWSNPPDASGRRSGRPYHTGPVGWGEPTTAGFWAAADSVERAIQQGDSFAFSGITGFPARRVDWFASRPARRTGREPVLALAW